MYQNHLLPNAMQAPGKRVLEIGFGDGHYFHHLSGFSYTILEVSEYASYLAERNSAEKLLLKIKPKARFPVQEMSIDFVFAIDSIYLIPYWRFELDGCVRVLDHGGRLSIFDRNEIGNLELHNVRRFNPVHNTLEQVADYLSHKGMSVSSTETFRGTYRSEVIYANGFFEHRHLKATKR